MRSTVLTVTLALCAAACRPPAEDPRPAAASGPVVHEFGVIPHGASRSADLPIPLPDAASPVVPVGFRRNCVCAAHRFVAVAADGSERILADDGVARAAEAIRPGERVLLRLTIDTAQKEAADVPAAPTPGKVVFQETGPGGVQHHVTVLYSFGIDAPVKIRPAAVLDLGDVPLGTRFAMPVTIRGDDGSLGFGEPRIVHPAATDLSTPDDLTVGDGVDGDGDGGLSLRVTMAPSAGRPIGPFAAELHVPTDRADGYVVRVPIRGRITPTIEISEPRMFSFGRIPLDTERQQSLVLTDHDPARDPEFHVVGIVDGGGDSLTEHFDVHLSPIDGKPRARHVQFVYRGTLRGVRGFRGEVLLAKVPGGEPIVHLPFSGFERRD